MPLPGWLAKLGHHREHHAVPLRQRMRGEPKSIRWSALVSASSCREVGSHYWPCVLVVDLEDLQATGRQRARRVRAGTRLPRQALEVVEAGPGRSLVVGGVRASVAALQQEELGSMPVCSDQPRSRAARDLAAQHLARAGVERLAGDETVAHEARIARHPGQGACVVMSPRPWYSGAAPCAAAGRCRRSTAPKPAPSVDQRASRCASGRWLPLATPFRSVNCATRGVHARGQALTQEIDGVDRGAAATAFQNRGCPSPRRTPAAGWSAGTGSAPRWHRRRRSAG